MAEQEQYASWTKGNYEPVQKHRAKKYRLIVYPQDMPENWRAVLREKMWDVLISPLHDKDVNADGTPKKPHHHVILSAGSAWITMKELVEVGETLRGMAIPQKCSNPKGMIRYFIHADNPEKAQYDKSDIEVYGNYDIEECFQRTKQEEDYLHAQIISFVKDKDIVEFSDLMDYCLENDYEWFCFLSRHSYMIDKYITSRRHKKKAQHTPQATETEWQTTLMSQMLEELKRINKVE
jgi:hypothetical protein